ncbi:hypothetical protein D7S68_26730 [Ralstonia pickettii]|nr:hypothetical protein [Ralstonia pickettii]MBA9885179.1 hypothetical protein [Ralstonia pickettii]MBA9888619.1 hypothetical protein [Ralstonia pickettii]MBA9894958.1 hypothetical protein [Ralstonia pickettii]MBA9926997.1 hypothetical protein [Ralstonia pickettii]
MSDALPTTIRSVELEHLLGQINAEDFDSHDGPPSKRTIEPVSFLRGRRRVHLGIFLRFHDADPLGPAGAGGIFTAQ